jgi:annexin A7/11
LGYGPATHIAWDATNDAKALRKAMKGFGTDERALIQVLKDKDPLQVGVLQQTYSRTQGRDLIKDIESEVSGYFEETLVAVVRGPLAQDVWLLRQGMAGPGTNEEILNDVLLSRSNADLNAIKAAYQQTHRRNLEADVKSELSMKTERHFLMVLAATRAESSAPVIPQQVDADVLEIYKATEGKMGTDELLVCQILSSRNDAQIGAIARAYEAKYRRSLEAVIVSEFSGHMQRALLHQLRSGVDKAMRDAQLLEHAMAGAGTKDRLLLNRVVRIHWDRNHLQTVKAAYRHKFGKDLGSRIRGETSGDFEKALCALIGE